MDGGGHFNFSAFPNQRFHFDLNCLCVLKQNWVLSSCVYVTTLCLHVAQITGHHSYWVQYGVEVWSLWRAPDCQPMVYAGSPLPLPVSRLIAFLVHPATHALWQLSRLVSKPLPCWTAVVFTRSKQMCGGLKTTPEILVWEEKENLIFLSINVLHSLESSLDDSKLDSSMNLTTGIH